MTKRTVDVTMALLRSAALGVTLTEEEKTLFGEESLSDLLGLAKKHDLAHLLAFGMKQNGLVTEASKGAEQAIFKAAFRYERLNFDYLRLIETLESAKIPFLPLKGSVIRAYYPEPWMRTSCDIDVLVHKEDLERGIEAISSSMSFELRERGTHDVSLFSADGMTHVELHFDLVEEGRARKGDVVLDRLWECVRLKDSYEYFYEMSDAFFYLYHIVHMAKHFEVGGCGVRPFLDLWILDHLPKADERARREIIEEAELESFTDTAKRLSRVWFDGEERDSLTESMEQYILHGGVYGSVDNRVALQQGRKGGRLGYILSRLFLSYEHLVRYYPVLEKRRWLMPLMQVRRWFRLLNPASAKRAGRELNANRSVESSEAERMEQFLNDIGL